ncbi:MAG: putative glycosyltransferase [Nocardia sp.]|uniref:mycofactocin biosynthesis glycosyltransferase MftF n=1 Tax=Nocardia sp. TaxID=1821 RepID=UPI00262AE438|nr:mycofactocin biosynthesis glycosyltransferase MftF [Nocardia sp.]MCU1644412.1 putative glycosyltransferase [Nocardia sp.]
MRLQLDASVRRFDGNRVLLGGSPTRLLRLGTTGVHLLDTWLAGTAVDHEPTARALARRLLDAGIVHPAPEPSADARTVVTLVVPVKNNPPGVARLLAATSDIPDRIVVDDGSEVPIGGATIRHDRSRGPAAARNTGWRRAATPLVAFLDSDTIPDPGWLTSVVPLFDDPSVAAVAPRIPSLTVGPVGHYEARRSSLDMGAEPAAVRPDGRVRYVPSAALVVRARALQAIDGFDESLRFGEDVDLVWRLLAAGYSVRYQPLSTVHHEPRGTIAAFLRQRFDYGTSAAPLSQRHPDLLHPAHLPAIAAVQGALAITGCPAAAAIPSVVTIIRTARGLHHRHIPLPTATTLAVTGQLRLIRQLADALRRVWWPLALCSRRGRRLLLVAYLAAAAESHRDGSGVMLRIGDDLAYGLGVWAGCLTHRTVRPLTPRLHRARKSP